MLTHTVHTIYMLQLLWQPTAVTCWGHHSGHTLHSCDHRPSALGQINTNPCSQHITFMHWQVLDQPPNSGFLNHSLHKHNAGDPESPQQL